MRISDWSSDVCSSDLLRLRRGKPVTGAEAHDTRMLQEAADDALYPDVVGQTRYPGTQAADAADDQVDMHPRPAGAIERLYQLGIDERVELNPDRRRAPGLGVMDFFVDQAQRCRLPRP